MPCSMLDMLKCEKTTRFLLISLLGGFGVRDISDVGSDERRQSSTAIASGRIFDRSESILVAKSGWRVDPKTDKMASESGVKEMMKI